MAKLGKARQNVFAMLENEYPDTPEYSRNAFREYERQRIAGRLFVMRNKAGLTQAEMAERMGVTQSAIAKLEDRGDTVRFHDIVRYARALGFGVDMRFFPLQTADAEDREQPDSLAEVQEPEPAFTGAF